MRIAVIWNPAKGDKDALESALLAELDETPEPDIHWFETTVEDPGRGAAAAAIEAGSDLLIVAGGDGTVRAVSEQLADSEADVAMAIVPQGTGNLFARNLDIPLNNLSAAFRRAIDGEARSVDIGWVEVEGNNGTERHGFVVMIGFGIDAQMIVETDDDLKSRAGWLAYVESLGRALSGSTVLPFTLSVDDGEPQSEEAHTLIIGNCGSLQAGVKLLPDADPSDGELDFVVLSAQTLPQWLGAARKLLLPGSGKQAEADADAPTDGPVRHGRASVLTVTLDEPRLLEIDGEELDETSAFTVTIQPSAVRVR